MIASQQPASAQKNAGSDRIPKPRILAGFSIPDHSSLAAAFRLAAFKVRDKEACDALFQGLDVSGLEALGRSYYEPATTAKDLAICRRGSAAISGLRFRRTRLCRVFMSHSRRDQAALLIHEALHVAGLSERPVDPNAMTAHEITQRVKAACGL